MYIFNFLSLSSLLNYTTWRAVTSLQVKRTQTIVVFNSQRHLPTTDSFPMFHKKKAHFSSRWTVKLRGRKKENCWRASTYWENLLNFIQSAKTKAALEEWSVIHLGLWEKFLVVNKTRFIYQQPSKKKEKLALNFEWKENVVDLFLHNLVPSLSLSLCSFKILWSL